MTTAPESTLLHADHLEREEAQVREWKAAGMEVPPAMLTTAEAIERFRRIRYHQGEMQKIRDQQVALVEPLLAEIERINAWAESEVEPYESSIAYHDAALQAYYRLNPPNDGKTVKLPGGTISAKEQPPQINYGDERRLALLFKERELAQFYRQPDPELEKVAVKKALVEQDGRVLLATPDGELLPLANVTITRPPDKITVKVEDKPKPPKAG